MPAEAAQAPQTIPYGQIPPDCLLVWSIEWTFGVELRLKRQPSFQQWCRTFQELADLVRQYELAQVLVAKRPLPVYLLNAQPGAPSTDRSQLRCAPLSYEQAQQLAAAPV